MSESSCQSCDGNIFQERGPNLFCDRCDQLECPSCRQHCKETADPEDEMEEEFWRIAEEERMAESSSCAELMTSELEFTVEGSAKFWAELSKPNPAAKRTRAIARQMQTKLPQFMDLGKKPVHWKLSEFPTGDETEEDQ